MAAAFDDEDAGFHATDRMTPELLPLTGADAPAYLFAAAADVPEHFAPSGADAGQAAVDALQDAEPAAGGAVLEIVGLDMPAPRQHEDHGLALIESELRSLEAAMDSLDADPSIAVYGQRSPEEQADITAVYDAAFGRAVKAARTKFTRATKDSLPQPLQETAKVYDNIIVVPALIEFANARNDVPFGTSMPVPDKLLREWFSDWLSGRDNNGRLEQLLRENASASAFRQWSGPEARARTNVLLGLDADGTIANANVWAAARLRRPFALGKYESAIQDAAAEAVLDWRRALAADDAAYEGAVRDSLRTGRLDARVAALPFPDREQRIREIARRMPVQIADQTIATLLDGIPYLAAAADDDDKFNLARALFVPDAAAEDDDDNDGVSPERRIDLVTRRNRIQAALGPFTNAARRAVLELERAVLQARLARAVARVPLVVHRSNTSAEAFVLGPVSIRGAAAPGQPVRVTWLFQPWNGPVRQIDEKEYQGGGGDIDSLTIVPELRHCNVRPGGRYDDQVAGRYWIEARQGNDGVVAKSAVAELHVWAVCARDRVRYELGVPLTFGECAWTAPPSTRKRRSDIDKYTKTVDGPRVPARLEKVQFDDDKDAGRDDTTFVAVDLTDDQAVLRATETWSMDDLLTRHGYLAALERIDGRLGAGTLLVEVQQAVPDAEAPADVRAALVVGRGRARNARDLRDVPVLSVLATLMNDPTRFALSRDESAFLRDALPARIMGEYVPAWRASKAGQRFVGARVRQLLDGLLSAERADQIERGAAKEAVARMTMDEMLAGQVWDDVLLAAYAKKKLAFFSDTDAIGRLRERAARIRLGLATTTPAMAAAAEWIGEHDWRSREPDWYEVTFAPIAGNVSVCELVQRGSERRPGAYPLHDEIDALRREHNGAAERVAGIADIEQRRKTVLEVTRLRVAIERAVVAFNVRMHARS